MRQPDIVQPISLAINAAAQATGVSRSVLYKAIRTGVLPSVKIGKRRLLLVEDLRGWLISFREAV